MKKIMNFADDFVNESLEGILCAHPYLLRMVDSNIRAICRYNAPVRGKVAIVTGGGYGHLPTFLGYVGEGMADGVAVGNAFTSPSCDSILAVTRETHSGNGVLYLYGNYVGDSMNFDMAAETMMSEGVETRSVRVSDDVASAPRVEWVQRRGVAGLFFAYKVAGARAGEHATLSEVARVTQKVVERTATMGVAMSSCSLPGETKGIFEIEEDEIEIGMGIHGEPGVKHCKMLTAREIADNLANRILDDLALESGARVAVLVNGLGSTTLEELHLLYREIKPVLLRRGVTPERVYVGEYATSFEMAGASVSLLRLDDELLRLLDAPCNTPFIRL